MLTRSRLISRFQFSNSHFHQRTRHCSRASREFILSLVPSNHEGHGAPRGANVLFRFRHRVRGDGLRKRVASRRSICGDFGREDRTSGSGRVPSDPLSNWLSPAFILSASSRERQSHVVGPDGDPSLPDATGANRARRRRILLRLKAPSRSAPHEQDTRNIIIFLKLSSRGGESRKSSTANRFFTTGSNCRCEDPYVDHDQQIADQAANSRTIGPP